MSEFRFEAEILLGDAVLNDVVRERDYGRVRVAAEWPAELATESIRVVLYVRGELEARDAPAYVELFFHDVYLLLNLSSPASFGGTIATTGDLRVRELTFRREVFLSARSVLLSKVTAWYDALQPGVRQRATRPEAIAIFQLLHLARTEEHDELAIIRLAVAAEALLGRADSLRRLFDLREQIAFGRTPTFHPMLDDGLDPEVEDVTHEWTEIIDAATAAVIGELQGRMG